MRGAEARVLFGPPECCFGATVDGDVGAGERVTIGRPLAGVTAQVLDPAGSPVPVQVAGELFVGGADGGRAEPGGPGAGVYRSGLRAQWLPDGRIELLGAAADRLDLRGFSVDRQRLQSALACHPGVREVRVALEPDVAGLPHLVAHVVPDDAAAAPTLAELRVSLWSELPGYAWPAAVTQAPPETVAEAAPETVAEEAFLAALWAEVASAEGVEAADNYWQSFPFLDVLTRATEAGVRIDGTRVARNRTVTTLATDLAAGRW